MGDLVLRPTIINNRRYRNDYNVVWHGDLGERRVGRIRLTESAAAPVWTWNLIADVPVPPSCNGRADSLKATQARFRKAFERFCDDAGDLSRAFQSSP
jgi:hypothetical protein